jgi:hypothetical protein
MILFMKYKRPLEKGLTPKNQVYSKSQNKSQKK